MDEVLFILVDAVGDELTMQCENKDNAPNCLWQIQGLPEKFTDLPQNDAKYYKRHTTKMTIKNISSTDSGIYRCRLFWASNDNRYSSPFELSKYLFCCSSSMNIFPIQTHISYKQEFHQPKCIA